MPELCPEHVPNRCASSPYGFRHGTTAPSYFTGWLGLVPLQVVTCAAAVKPFLDRVFMSRAPLQSVERSNFVLLTAISEAVAPLK